MTMTKEQLHKWLDAKFAEIIEEAQRITPGGASKGTLPQYAKRFLKSLSRWP